MTRYVIDGDAIDRIAKYLSKRRYRDVAYLLSDLAQVRNNPVPIVKKKKRSRFLQPRRGPK